MKLQMLMLKDDEVFILRDSCLVGRCSKFVDIMKRIGELTGNEIVLEKYPFDELYQIFSCPTEGRMETNETLADYNKEKNKDIKLQHLMRSLITAEGYVKYLKEEIKNHTSCVKSAPENTSEARFTDSQQAQPAIKTAGE